MKYSALIFAILIQAYGPFAWSQEPARPQTQQEDVEQLEVLQQGAKLMKAGRPREAISGYFDKVISFYELKYRDRAERIYCSRSMTETLYYLTKHAKQEPKTSAAVVRVWCDAHFLKAFALVDLGLLPDAKASLQSAVSLSPGNSQYLSELAHIYQLEKDWAKALETYQAAEVAAQFSDAQVKNNHLSRARRGLGYVLIELDRLDEAELKYKQCLEMDKNDSISLNQVEYIRRLRASRSR